MSTIAALLSKAWLVLAMAVTGLASGAPAQAVSQAVSPNATTVATSTTYPRLQQAWTREQDAYTKLGTFFDTIDQRITRGQGLIDRAKANGKDVTALQAALDAFSSAVKQAQPLYEGTKGIVSSHQGFDTSGNVIDPTKAFETVMDMRAKLLEIRQLIKPAGTALRQAIRDFRQVNQPVATPTP